MKHKHAEILIAIAEGKQVQFFNNGIWQDYSIPYHSDPLIESSVGYFREWRVKKEPVIDERFYKFHANPYFCSGSAVLCPVFNVMGMEWDLKITYQDGVAIKSELPK